MKWTNRKTVTGALLTFTVALAMMSGLVAKDKLDIMNLDRRAGRMIAGRMMAPALDQTYVYHTNNNMWMGWDSYGNTGDQTCSAIVPGWVYPGTFSTGGHGWLNYNCRAGYWIIAKVGSEFIEGTTGEYVLTRGTEPGPTSMAWADEDNAYNKEPWVSNSTWYIPEANLTVNAIRKSWSFPGSTNDYYAVGDYDYNDFVVEEISVTNTGSADIDELVLGSKADHDCTWNVPYPDWDFPFWTDDIVDYDHDYMLTMELDGDDQSSAVNDFGIDDPNREYRGTRVSQTVLEINGTAYSSLTASDVNHMWWTGDEDPQTAAARYAMATMVSGSGDKKDNNPPAMDMRYLQSYSVSPLAAGETATFVVAVLAGAGLANAKKAAANARQAYDWDFDLPKPPAAPQIAWDTDSKTYGVVTNPSGYAVVNWSYSDAQITAVDPDIGAADFAGFRVYRSSPVPRYTSAELGLTADNLDDGGSMEGDIDQGKSFSPNAGGPYFKIADISYSDGSFAMVSGFMKMGDMYMFTDENVAIGVNYWYYVAAYDAGGASATHGVTLPSLESYSTMCYPLVADPYGADMIPTTPPMFTVKPEVLEYTDLAGNTVSDVFVTPNPWRALDMEQYHGAASATGYFVRFYNVDVGDIVEIYDVSGNLIFTSDAVAEKGTYDWNLISRTRNQVSTGIYYWSVGNENGKLAVIR